MSIRNRICKWLTGESPEDMHLRMYNEEKNFSEDMTKACEAISKNNDEILSTNANILETSHKLIKSLEEHNDKYYSLVKDYNELAERHNKYVDEIDAQNRELIDRYNNIVKHNREGVDIINRLLEYCEKLESCIKDLTDGVVNEDFASTVTEDMAEEFKQFKEDDNNEN